MSSNLKAWSSFPTKAVPISTDLLAILDSEDGNSTTKNKTILISSLPGGISGVTSLNADTTAAQIIAAGGGLGIADVGATHTLSIDSTVATLTGTQILTNKTLTTPTIVATGFTNMQHTHQATNTGGQLLAAAVSDFATATAATASVTANTAKVTNQTHTGDATGSTALTIANNAVTLAKIQDIATSSFLGRVTAATGDPEVLTGTQATTLLNVFTSSLKGLVPSSGGGTTNFLRADGTFAAPPGAAQTPWTSNIDADGFDLQDLSNIEFRTTTGAPAGTVQAIYADAGGIISNVPTSDDFDFQINAVSEYTFNSTQADFQGNNLINVGLLNQKIDNTTAIHELEANHTTPADAQVVGQIDFIDDDSVGARRTYGQFRSVIQDPLSTSIDAELFISTVNNNILHDYFIINEAGNGHIELDTRTSGANIFLNFAGTSEYNFSSTQADFKANNVVDLGSIQFNVNVAKPASTINYIVGNGTAGLFYNVPSGDAHSFQVAGSTHYTMTSSSLDLGGKNITQINQIEWQTSSVIIQGSGAGLLYRVPTGDIHDFKINEVTEYTFSATAFTLATGNNIVIQASGATGFMDIGEITTPANPAANVGRLYVKDVSATTTLFFRDFAGVETDLLAGGVGNMVLADTQTSTGKKTFQADATNAGINVGILTADPSTLVNGDRYYNSTSNKNRMVENSTWIDVVTDTRNITLAADATEESIIGSTLTKVKDMSFIKGVISFQTLTIEIDLKTDNITNPAICRVRHDSLGTDDLVLQTSSLTYVVLSGTIDVSAFSTGRHTIEFYLEDGAGETATLRETWVFGKE